MFSKKKKNINKVEVAPNTNENKEKTVKQIRFNYTVKDSDGREIKGYFDAFSKIEVQTFLQNQGYEVIKIEEELLEIKEKDSIEEKVIFNDEKLLLYKKMQTLDEKTREVIYLRITGELSFKEIGIILNKTENWARVTFYRGKNQLKEVD